MVHQIEDLKDEKNKFESGHQRKLESDLEYWEEKCRFLDKENSELKEQLQYLKDSSEAKNYWQGGGEGGTYNSNNPSTRKKSLQDSEISSKPGEDSLGMKFWVPIEGKNNHESSRRSRSKAGRYTPKTEIDKGFVDSYNFVCGRGDDSNFFNKENIGSGTKGQETHKKPHLRSGEIHSPKKQASLRPEEATNEKPKTEKFCEYCQCQKMPTPRDKAN